MIIVLRKNVTKQESDSILKGIENLGLEPLYLPGSEKIVIGALGDERKLQALQLEALPFVERVIPILEPHKLVNRKFHDESTVITLGAHAIGGGTFTFIAGPCAVESREQIIEIARQVKDKGGHVLRGGAFKPRTSPYSFQGLKEEGLEYLKEARAVTGLPICTEIIHTKDVERYYDYYDILQIGARNMQNYDLLLEAGKIDKPVLLKRGLSARLEELIMCAEYIALAGNPRIILCERGIRTFETAMRNTLDLAAVPYLKRETHLPVVVDPSHGTGDRELAYIMAKAAAIVGADGILIEVHTDPDRAKSDGKQTISTERFSKLVGEIEKLMHLSAKECQ
ncbi:MAG: 3-deoxy-7-phosphoheptulonate synthase [Candidatus Eremiobacteraeota bacterium]|nr:3-deoxy-7-phosphoheptulonate synthase [Candidatus Eremiobacteraeota bacterium]